MQSSGIPSKPMRKARFAGSWYPADERGLGQLVSVALSGAKMEGPFRFAVLPHAGLYYAARGIAPFFTKVSDKTEKLLVIAPSHYEYLPADILATYNFASMETPFGMLDGFDLSFSQHTWQHALEAEHAVEMVLPFIAHLPSVPKVALALLSSLTEVEPLANQLIEELGIENLNDGRTCIIASSDFTHYGPRFGYTPYGLSGAQQKVAEQDKAMAQWLATGEIPQAKAWADEHRCTICGLAPSLVVAQIAKACGAKGFLAEYYTSEDVLRSTQEEFVAYATILWR